MLDRRIQLYTGPCLSAFQDFCFDFALRVTATAWLVSKPFGSDLIHCTTKFISYPAIIVHLHLKVLLLIHFLSHRADPFS